MKHSAGTTQYALLVEDEWSVQEAYTNLLGEFGFAVTVAETVEAAHRAIDTSSTRFDLAVIDIRLRHDGEEHPRSGDASGITVAHRFKIAMPDAAVLFISSHERYLPEVLNFCMQGYVGSGFILKGTKKAMTYEAITQVLEGKIFLKLSLLDLPPSDIPIQFLSALHPTVARAVQQVAAKLSLLSEQERQVVQHLTVRTAMIARRLELREKTVINYLQRIYEKLGVNEGHEQSQILRRDMIIMLAVLFQSLQPKDKDS